MRIILINGRPRVGKDMFVQFCAKHCHWCLNVSTVDFVKKVASYCGWNGEKTPDNRAFLSQLKALLTEWQDVPYKKVADEITKFHTEAISYDADEEEIICFIHCREPEEIAKFVSRMNAETLLIRRPMVDLLNTSNPSDRAVFDWLSYDYTIYNDGSLDRLEEKAVEFLTQLGIKNLK